MRIENSTTVSTRAIRDVVAFVRPPGIGGFTVKVWNERPRGGRLGFASDWENTVAVRLPLPGRPVRGWKAHGAYLDTPTMAGRLEFLVYILAHELRHLWQAQVPRGRRVWGSRGQFSERDADAYALRMLRAWRRREPKGRV